MEKQYIALVQKIITEGVIKNQTLSVFGGQLQFDIQHSFPLLTCKKVSLKNVFGELQWFLRGQTDNSILQKQNIRIWDGNAKYCIDKGYNNNDLGPIYGFQWRRWGSDYFRKNAPGIDQIKNIQKALKCPKQRQSRRLILSAWNVSDIPKMVLPPCHIVSQFYVRNQFLDIHMYQRSADVGLGVPYNIASYSLLIYLMAKTSGLTPGRLIVSFGDAHIYLSQREIMEKLTKNQLYDFPSLEVLRNKENVWEYEFSDLRLDNYKNNGIVKIPLTTSL